MASLLVVTTQSIHPKNIAGYVCPSCRMVFSLPQDMDGNGATCPGCDYLLTIPSREDGVSELGVSGTQYNRVKSKGTRNSKLNVLTPQRSLQAGEHHEWADSPQEHGDKVLKIMIPIAIVSLLLIGGLGYFLLVENNDVPNDRTNTIVDTVTVDPTIVDPVIVDPDGSGTKAHDGNDTQGIYIYNSEDDDQVARLNEFLKVMFAAKTVDEMLPHVRPVENIREKMVKFYKGETLSQSPLKELNFAQNTPDYPEYLTFRSQTQDYSSHFGVLKYSKDEILLDWESFVAYSDMSWEELAEKKPTKSVRVRVTATRAFYYNEEFTDEAKWQAVSLNSPNEGDAIYGYVQKGSATSQRLFNFGLSDNRKVVLDVYFPEGAKEGNQVFIERVVQQGWVIKEEK